MASWHAGGMLWRAWCTVTAEVLRTPHDGLKALGLCRDGQDNTDAIIRGGGELFCEGRPALTTLVFVQGLANNGHYSLLRLPNGAGHPAPAGRLRHRRQRFQAPSTPPTTWP